MKKIVIFNHKGGVSKTTTAFHIGWMLAKREKKVLLVDADPQCNLTALFLGSTRFDSYYEEEETKKNNIKDGVAMVFNGDPVPIRPFECPLAERNPNLYLLPGHMNLSEYERSLNLSLALSFETLKNLPGAFNELINLIGIQYSIDYVIIDLNPALSALNQVLFLTSDAFLIPVNPDSFSLMALASLSRILPSWVLKANDLRNAFPDATYRLPETTPLFLGIIYQRFNIRNGVATAPYRDKIRDLEETVNKDLVPSLSKAQMTFSPKKYEEAGMSDDKALMEIKDFQGLAPKSQQWNVPVFELSDTELGTTGAVLEGMQANRDEFGRKYQEICDKIEILLS